MRKILKINSLVLILVLMFNMLFPILSIAAEEKVTISFKDKNLYNAILTKLGSKVESSNEGTLTITITKANLETVTTLELNEKQITDVSGIEKFTSLTSLNLNDNQKISDIKPITQLPNLEKLYLKSNEITDITLISSLTKLKSLGLGSNKISNMEPLRTLINITWLNLSDNKISDITSLQTLTNITYLALNENKISDITPISSLTNLEKLYLYNNEITDITPLSSLTKLKTLGLGENEISNISPLQTLTNITYLALNENKISDITPISSLTNLEKLYLYNNEITDISPLQTLTNITLLSAYANKINDITPLASLTNLETLYLNNNEISDITPLASLTNLKKLYLYNNEITDISPLSSLTNLTELSLTSNKISDITPLRTLTNITWLNLGHNKVSDITSLSSLTNLETLWLYSTEITDISPLASLSNLKNLGLYNNKITSFEPLSNLTTLTCLYASNVQISDISSLKKLTNIKWLYLSNNNIEDISVLANLKELIWLSIGGNPNLKDVSALANCTKLETLWLHNNNIENISELKTLTNLKDLGISGNKISDLSIVDEIASLKLTNKWRPNLNSNDDEITVSSNYQNISKILTKTEAANEITLPQIFTKIKDKHSKLYTEEALELVNCTLSSDGTKIKLNENVNEATVTIKGGAIADSKFVVKVDDGKPPVLDVKYSTTEPTNKSVTVTITSNKELKEVEGWKLSEDKLSITKEYTQNVAEEITVQDFAGNTGKTKVVINNIDVTAPEVEVEYSTTETTNDTVTVTVKSNEKLKEVKGWTLSEDKLILTKEYTDNTEETLIIYDLAGNERKIPIRIANINKVELEAKVEYSTTEATKGTVKVTIKANKKIKQVEGWTLDEAGVTLTKTYAQNAEEVAELQDLTGNKVKVNIKINNIDTTVPQVEVKYSTTEVTKKKVTVTIVANEKLQELEGWKLSEDKLTLTKDYYKNVEEEITILDLVGNKRTIPIKITNIDMVELQAEVKYSTTELTRETVKVTIKANKDIQSVEGWILEEDGETLTKVYTQNKKEEVTICDYAGNEKKITITISNIDTTAPEVEVKYSTTKTTTENVTVEIVANEQITGIEGWSLSNDKTTLTKTYSQNKEEEVTIYDLAGNSRKVTIKVNNIEKKDNTTAGGTIPKTGKNVIIISLTCVLLVGIVSYIKLRKFKGIR